MNERKDAFVEDTVDDDEIEMFVTARHEAVEDDVIVKGIAGGNSATVESEQKTEWMIAILELNVVVVIELAHLVRVQMAQ